jgi:hypothetical protein
VALTDRATFDELAKLMCVMWLEGGEQRVKCLLDTLVAHAMGVLEHDHLGAGG